jgi:hypothetical protein
LQDIVSSRGDLTDNSLRSDRETKIKEGRTSYFLRTNQEVNQCATSAKSDNQQWFMIALFAGFFINLMTSAIDSSFQMNLSGNQHRLYSNVIITFGLVIIFGLASHIHRYFTKPTSEIQRKSDNYYHELYQLEKKQDEEAK